MDQPAESCLRRSPFPRTWWLVPADDPELAGYLRIEKRELEAGAELAPWAVSA
jgi:hypothetical protein